MGRVLFAIGVGAILLVQSATALAAPSPAPALEGILLEPPGADLVEQPISASGSFFEGPFDANGYALTTGTDSEKIRQSLDEDGFLSGFGRTWLSKANNNGYVEFVMAFKGAKGAKAWLRQSEVADKAEPNYVEALPLEGIESYYGLRIIDSVNRFYAEAFAFVKGNDMIFVSYVSAKNDLATLAPAQAKRQYLSAPEFTIPPAQWPEVKASNPPITAARIAAAFLVGVVIIGLFGAAGLLLLSRRRRPLQPLPVFVQSGAAHVPIAAIRMSDDRRFWWDGTSWRNAEHEVPPAAQRSGDGRYWWDGDAWREVAAANAQPDARPEG